MFGIINIRGRRHLIRVKFAGTVTLRLRWIKEKAALPEPSAPCLNGYPIFNFSPTSRRALLGVLTIPSLKY